MVKQYKNQKAGFSLFEALVSMLIMSLFFLATSKILTQKQVTEVRKNTHGYYECYVVNGAMFEHSASSSGSSQTEMVNQCTPKLSSDINFYNIHYFNSDGTQYNNKTVYHAVEQQSISNNITVINRPRDILEYITALNIDDEDNHQVINPPDIEQVEKTEFKTYINMAYSGSDIKKFSNPFPPGFEALLIAW